MSNAVAMFSGGAVPAHIAAARQQLGSNIPDKETVPTLSYEGKVWAISLDGNKSKLMTRNEDGDQVPVSVFRAVILNSAPRRGRAFYPGSYDPANVAPPTCWSADGIVPHPSLPDVSPDPANPKLPHKWATACGSCPNAVKGSKVNDNGVASTACSQHRMLALVPSGKLDFTPLRLKIAITSDWDANSPEMEAQGWYSFQKYLDFLKARGVQHTGELVTKMRFDANTAYPKLFFAADRWLEPAEVAQVATRVNLPEVTALVDGSWTPAGADGVKAIEGNAATSQTAQSGSATTSTTQTAASRSKPKPEPEVAAANEDAQVLSALGDALSAMAAVEDDEDIEEAVEFAEAGFTPPASEMVIDVEPEPVQAPKKAAAKPKPTPAAETTPAASTKVPDEIADLLADWGE